MAISAFVNWLRPANPKPVIQEPRKPGAPIDLTFMMDLLEQGRSGKVEDLSDRGIKYGYKESSWAYSCIRRISEAASPVPWIVKERGKDNQFSRVEGHPAEGLLAMPNHRMSGQDLIERTCINLYTGGNGLWYKARTTQGIGELWPVNPKDYEPIKDVVQFVSMYRRKQNRTGGQDYEAKDIVHFQFCDPDNPWWGMSPLQPVGMVVDCDVEAVRWWRNSIQNRCVKDGLLSFKHDLATEQYANVIKLLRNQVLGSWGARAPLVLGHEANFTPYSMTPAELDFMNTRDAICQEICAALGVNPLILGILKNSSYNNIRTARYMFWMDTVIPFLCVLRSTMNLMLMPEYLSKGQKPGDLIIDFDLTEIDALMEGYAQKVKIALDLFNMGTPFNTIVRRLKLGIPELEGGDVGYVTAQVTPVDHAMPANSIAGSEDTSAPREAPPKPPSRPGGVSTPMTDRSPSTSAPRGSLRGERPAGSNGNSLKENERSPARKAIDDFAAMPCCEIVGLPASLS